LILFRRFLEVVQEHSSWLLLVVLSVIFTFLSGAFLTFQNFVNILQRPAVIGIVCYGFTFVIIGKGFDLSIASTVGLTSFLTAKIISMNGGLIEAILACIGMGMLIGCVNGVIVTKLRINSIIATLGMMMALTGIKLILTQGHNIYIHDVLRSRDKVFPLWLRFIGSGTIGPVPTLVVINAAIAIICLVILRKTRFGRWVYLVGANESAAFLSGVNTKLIRILTYVICGLLSGLAGFLLTAELEVFTTRNAMDYLMPVMLAVVLGGTSPLGGSGGIICTVVGTVIVALVRNGLILTGMPYYMQEVLLGIFFISVVGVDVYYRRKISGA